jgi:hypothetical protein
MRTVRRLVCDALGGCTLWRCGVLLAMYWLAAPGMEAIDKQLDARVGQEARRQPKHGDALRW